MTSANEREALAIAYGNKTTDSDEDPREEELRGLNTLYGLCAENGKEFYSGVTEASAEQIPELRGALMLCPDHPQRKHIDKITKTGQTVENLRKQGRIFGGGVLLVGKNIKPGTYVASNGRSCYWERQNREGKTIENGFHSNSARVQVNIRSSDYAFSSERCGEWSPAK